MRQVGRIRKQLHYPPFLIAGDLFHDGWRQRNCPPELLNFAMANLPSSYGLNDTDFIAAYAVPGQHDLPHHRIDDLGKSAFNVLLRADRLQYLRGTASTDHNKKLRLWGFPWGDAVKPPSKKIKGVVDVAVIHDCIWIGDKGYTGAPPGKNIQYWRDRLDGYEVAVFGDNHKGFVAQVHNSSNTLVVNCGCLIRRRSDEKDEAPGVHVVYEDLSHEKVLLDCSEDKWFDAKDVIGDNSELSDTEVNEAVEELAALGDKSVDFLAALVRSLRRPEVSKAVAQVVTDVVATMRERRKK